MIEKNLTLHFKLTINNLINPILKATIVPSSILSPINKSFYLM